MGEHKDLMAVDAVRHLYEITDEDTELVCSLITVIAEQYSMQIDALAELFAAGDNEMICRNAHKLKGSLFNMGAQQAAALVQRLERAAECSDLLLISDLQNGVFDVCDELAANLRRERQSLIDKGVACEKV